MKPFRIRLTIILMALIGISMTGAGITMAQLFKDSHISVLEENMSREIKLLSGTFSFMDTSSPDALNYYTEQAERISVLTGSRVTFITKQGRVIGDSRRIRARWTTTLPAKRSCWPRRKGLAVRSVTVIH